VLITFNASPASPDIRVSEYKGVSATSPLDGAVASSGTSATCNSGPLTTTNANDLLIAANTIDASTIGPGPGYGEELLTWSFDEILEDQIVSSPGSYTATAPLVGSAPWIMQLVAFKLAAR
jgi:hypothetical protein